MTLIPQTRQTITVLRVGNTSGDNTGTMNLYAGGVNVTPSTSGGSFFLLKIQQIIY